MTNDADRLDDIEFRHACLARTVEQLDEVVVEHARTLESLGRLVKRLEERLQGLEAAMGGGGASSEEAEDGSELGESPDTAS